MSSPSTARMVKVPAAEVTGTAIAADDLVKTYPGRGRKAAPV